MITTLFDVRDNRRAVESAVCGTGISISGRNPPVPLDSLINLLLVVLDHCMVWIKHTGVLLAMLQVLTFDQVVIDLFAHDLMEGITNDFGKVDRVVSVHFAGEKHGRTSLHETLDAHIGGLAWREPDDDQRDVLFAPHFKRST